MNTCSHGFKWVAGLCLIFGWLVNVKNTQAYTYYITLPNNQKIIWPGKQIRYRAAQISFPPGSVQRTAFKKVIGRWNESPSAFTFLSPVWNDTSVAVKNGQSEIWFTTDPVGSVNYGQIKWNVDGTADFVESDVVHSVVPWPGKPELWAINSNSQFNMLVYGGSREMWEPAVLHEMGHGLGLAHTNNTYNIMGDHRKHLHANNGRVREYVGEDTGNGTVFLYGGTNAIFSDDLGVTHWKYGSAGGEYSKHILTKIYHISSGNIVSSDPFEGVRRYKVNAGSTYRVQFTYENNGLGALTNVSVGYYISTNRNITTYDTLFSSHTRNFYRNTVYTMKRTLTIPSNLTVGQTYWLGVIVDYTGQYFEVSSINNATHIPIKIIP